MSKLKLLLPLAAFALLALLLARGLQLNPRELPSPLIGKPLPAFEVQALPEGILSSTRMSQGRISVLNVWASWCGPCRVEHPLLIELARRHPQVQLIGLATRTRRRRRWPSSRNSATPSLPSAWTSRAASASTSAFTACPRPMWWAATAVCCSSMSVRSPRRC